LRLRTRTTAHAHAHRDDEVDEKWAGWGLAIFEELVDKSLLDFVEELTAAGTGVKVTTFPRLLYSLMRWWVYTAHKY
jgi:hypothetical protein